MGSNATEIRTKRNPKVITPSFIVGTLSLLAGYFFRTVFYSGKKGKHPVFSKWFFYIVYPAHLALIYILVLLLKA